MFIPQVGMSITEFTSRFEVDEILSIVQGRYTRADRKISRNITNRMLLYLAQQRCVDMSMQFYLWRFIPPNDCVLSIILFAI